MRLDSQEPTEGRTVRLQQAAGVAEFPALSLTRAAQPMQFSQVTVAWPGTTRVPEPAAVEPARRRAPRVRPAAGLLLVILTVQALLSLRLVWSNTAFQDEALYLWAGRLEWQHLLHGTPLPDLAAYFSGAPVVYPPLGAAAAALGGLAGARILSLVFMLGATCLLWSITTRLVSTRAAFFACGAWAVLGPTQRLGAFATYDAMSLFLLALATWCAVRAAGRSDWRGAFRKVAPSGSSCTRWLIAAAAATLVANAAKYASVIFDPVVIAVAGLAACPRPGGKRAAARWTITLTYLVAGAIALLLIAGHSYELGIDATTLSRAMGQQSPSQIATMSWQWIGVVLVAAVAGVAVSLVGPGRQASRTLLLCALLAAVLLVPAEQARIHTLTSLDKHVAFGAWFGAIAAGYAADRLISLTPWRRVRTMLASGAAIMLVPVAATGAAQAGQLFAWPNAAPFVRALRPLARRDPGPLLVETSSVAEFYLSSIPWQRWSSTYSITTPSGQSVGYSTRSITDFGQPAVYRGYIRRGYFALVALNFTGGPPAIDLDLASLLRRDRSYRVVASVPYGGSKYIVWQRVPAPAKGRPRR